MANTAALIRESIWRNREFRALPRAAQCTYLQLCSQKDLDCAGLLTLNVGLLAKGCGELDTAGIREDLETLEAQRFIFVDEETDELFIRSYMRTAEVVKSPNIRKSAFRSARHVESLKIRAELAVELRRLRHPEANQAADDIDPTGTHRPDPTNPSGTLPKNGTLPEPSSTRTVTSTGTSLVVNHLGEGNNPRPECSKHEENYDGPCRQCQLRREWDERNTAQAEADQLDAKRRQRQWRLDAIAGCAACDENGFVETDRGLARCAEHSLVQVSHA